MRFRTSGFAVMHCVQSATHNTDHNLFINISEVLEFWTVNASYCRILFSHYFVYVSVAEEVIGKIFIKKYNILSSWFFV
jgi:hypothetical protein